MRRRTSFLFVALFLMSTVLLSGCFGLLTSYPIECSADLPIIAKTANWESVSDKEKQRYDDLFVLSNKNNFIEKWGNPDETIAISENNEILVYKNRVWCGILPAWVIGVPLMLPVCEGFDRVTFKNNKAIHVHFKKQSGAGFLFPIGVLVPNQCPVECTPPKNSQERTE